LQDRLPKELKLAGISTVEAANRWLRDTYMAQHNKQFAVAAEQEGSAFVADAMGAWREILCVQGELSMAARNSPKSSGRNSPLHSELVTAKSSRRSDIGEGIEVEIDDLLKRLSGGAVAQAFGQGVGPGGILGL
jgi:hypothetical protein